MFATTIDGDAAAADAAARWDKVDRVSLQRHSPTIQY
jgi:hypothetical protein